jgi:hypothetical protein
MGTAVRPAKTSPGPWDAFGDVDVFVDEVLAEAGQALGITVEAIARGRDGQFIPAGIFISLLSRRLKRLVVEELSA